MKILIEVNAPGWDGSLPATPKEESMDLQVMHYIKALVKSRIEREPEVQLSIVSNEFVLVNADELLRLQSKARTGLTLESFAETLADWTPEKQEAYRAKLRELYDNGED